uniref:Conserved oligomeric Golgi complex subunit 2 n=1 Tax=Ditylenchus dipsaci TaxID=166011 RepID=A0A915DT48_9BILA
MVNTLSNGIPITPTTKPTVLDGAQLCFNKAHFNREDFNVDRFVNLARRRATLDQIHNDLRTYLRFLQNSMINLINDDYADFVNLSSTLAVLKDSIDKISSNAESSWTSFSASTEEIQKAAQFVQQKCSTLSSNQRDQIMIRNKIFLLNSVERLSKSLRQRPSALSSWFSKLINQCWQKRSQRQLQFHRDATLASYSIAQLDFAVVEVSTNVIDQQIICETGPKDVLLQNLFTQIIKLREKWLALLNKQSQLRPDIEAFLDSCLLTYCVSFLEERFGSVLVPSDNRLFHKCFCATIKFVQNWPSKNCEAMLKSLKNKFNTIVYFKMETQQYLTEIKAHSKPAEFTYTLNETAKDGCICSMSSSILVAIEKVFSDEIYLASIIDKLWDFTLKCLSNYVDWIKSLNLHFVEESDKEENNEKKSVEQWLALVALVWDIASFNSKLLKLCSGVVWKRLQETGAEITPFEECLAAFTTEIDDRTNESIESIAKLLLAKMTKELTAVSDIPRQYRWTRKPAPTCFSSYLQSAFSVCEVFSTESSKIGWTGQQVSVVLKKVLDSVEQTGSSLQRFKKKMLNENQTDSGDSDEAKIRKQLVYDTDFVKQRVEEHGLDLERLNLLQKRAQEAQ